MHRLAISTVAALVLAGTATATAASVPAWAWWTPSQASRNVVKANPQRIDLKGHKTTLTDAACKGIGGTKGSGYRSFACAVRYHDDTLDCCSFGTTLYVTTSTAKRNAIACWSRSSVALARGDCRPPKIGG